MDARFWHEKWQANQIGFHKDRVHPMLEAHLDHLGLAKGARVFVPLCGKTLDIGWLLARGYRVAGVELSRLAVDQLFEGLGVTPEITGLGAIEHVSAPGIDIHVGDIFGLEAGTLGPVDAVYDRAAMVALPAEMRIRYAAHMTVLTGCAPQFLITFDYDQSIMSGPPFSVPEAEVRAQYADAYQVDEITRAPVDGGLKGLAPATEIAWHLH